MVLFSQDLPTNGDRSRKAVDVKQYQTRVLP